jgi:hypothetical protein
MEDTSMRKAIYSIMAIIAIAAGLAAAGTTVQAKYLYPPCECNDGNG